MRLFGWMRSWVSRGPSAGVITCMRTIAAVLMALGLAATPGGATEPPDPTSLSRTGRPNDFLVCAVDACAASADAQAPMLTHRSDAVFAAWLAVIEAAERTRIVASDPERLLIVAEQRSAVFGFVDSIAVRVLELRDGDTSFAAYSRSEVGYWDLGVNRRRLLAWTATVERRLMGP